AEAREIIPNTEVWLNGERIGAVRSVQFQPATSEPDKRLVVTLDLLEVARPYVRRDATVQVRRGASFLGAPVIYVSGGTASTPAVRRGDTLATTIWLDQDELSEQIRVGFTDARTVMANVRRTAGAIQEAQGSLAGLFAGEGSAQLSELQQVRTSLAGLTSG